MSSTVISLDPAPEIQSCEFEKRNRKRHERTAVHRAQLKFYNLPQPEEDNDPNPHNPGGSKNSESTDLNA
ncbi:2799_t:CDS:2 [Acaulospora colombiana]|uniref:2799_t:CDS:1 n=1 Tax=Acaulospora colombiana TaxID=27376 RepID=A0ACA9NVZ6_9GLOM|nr:2799_t:CDS:2 [Acaulospora colombiana]